MHTGERDSWLLRNTKGGGFRRGAIVVAFPDICSFLLFRLTLPPPSTHTHAHSFMSPYNDLNSTSSISTNICISTTMAEKNSDHKLFYELSPLSPSCGVEGDCNILYVASPWGVPTVGQKRGEKKKVFYFKEHLSSAAHIMYESDTPKHTHTPLSHLEAID